MPHANDAVSTPLDVFPFGPRIDWKPDHLGASSWLEHVPFAFWCVHAARPDCLVELGTHYGVSYFAFCQAVARLELPTRCFAVDTWEGDAHAGAYDQQVFDTVTQINRRSYAAFSNLLRMPFDAAQSYFADGEIDVLHIDGFHTYEAVAHDFALWRPKLSPRAVVLFHDVNVREREFGVWRFWEEIAERFPSFAFHHGFGLGVAAVGPDIPAGLRPLFAAANDPDQAAAVRAVFAARGEAVLNAYRITEYIDQTKTFFRKEVDYKTTLRQERLDAVRQTEARLQRTISWRITAPLRLAQRLTDRIVRRGLSEARRLRAAWRIRRQARSAAKPGDARLNVVWVGGEPDTPGYYYRVFLPAQAARAAGANVVHCRLDELDTHLEAVATADLVVLWRGAWNADVARLFSLAKAAGALICFDLDDLMFDSRLARVDVIDGIRSQGLKEELVVTFYDQVRKTMDAADLCLASTEELAGHMRAFGKTVSLVPNGFDEERFMLSRQAARRRQAADGDGLLRLGYAGGSRTHQRDFAVCAGAVAKVLQAWPNTKLVLFRDKHETPLVDLEEYPDLLSLVDKIEWRTLTPVAELPGELARFDVNLAPVECGNLFCEAKSELKFFEAALAGVCTVASPTGPFRRAIRHEETGFLAETEDQWIDALNRLLGDARLRQDMSRRALHDVLWTFGPQRRTALVHSFLEQTRGGRQAAQAFALYVRLAQETRSTPVVPDHETAFASDHLGTAAVTVIIPLHNYENYIIEALDSVAAQTEVTLDLIVVDDASTDSSLSLATKWAREHQDRFNRLLVLRNTRNAKLGLTRNVGFAAADTLYVLPLDADNLLLPECVSLCLETMRRTQAAFVYPKIMAFGDECYPMGDTFYAPQRFVGGNYIDAMALISKEAWLAAGGYENVPHQGWEDYEFWCRLVELGLAGEPAGDKPLAKYRVHGASMLSTSTNIPQNRQELGDYLRRRHSWLRLAEDPLRQDQADRAV
jgi:glycosyltransferase involved in cell wall biosynthesis